MLTYDILVALLIYVVSTSITPGPNNIMILTSGVNFGVRRSLPHFAGISLGFAAMVAAVGLGLGQVFERFPVTNTVLRVAGAAYLLWLAYKIAMAKPSLDGASSAQPMSFFAAAAFQWVNPKAWVMAAGSIVAFTQPEAFSATLAMVVAMWVMFGAPCTGAWLLFGAGMRRFLADPVKLRAFNVTMAVLLVLSLWPMVRPLFA